MKVCVIGGAGRMGSWFARYFRDRGHEVSILDLDEERSERVSIELGVRSVRDVRGTEADVYFICVPTSAVAEVLSRINREVANTRATIVEISSVKSPLVSALKESLGRGFSVLSIHPMFGPGTSDPSKSPTVLISLAGDGSEVALARGLMPDLNFIVMSADEHDRFTSFSLSLTHFVNMAFCLSICEEDLSRLKEVAGASFNSQVKTLGHVLDGGDAAIADTLTLNSKSVYAIERFLEVSKSLLAMVRGGCAKDLKKEVALCKSILPSLNL